MGHTPSGAWIPDHTLREHEAARARQIAEVNLMAQLTSVCKEWTPLLKEIDEDLEMVFFDENARSAGVAPGRFHVVRWNSTGPPGLIPVTGPNGEFTFPYSQLLDKVREADLWDDRVIKDREKRDKKIEAAKARQEEQEARERAEEYEDRVKALINPSVSMTGQGKGWNYRAAGRK